MPLRNFNPNLSKEAQDAISDAFDAVAEWHKELGSSTENVTRKMAIAAQAVGWPNQVVTAITSHVQSITHLQIHMMNHMLDAWQEQIKSSNPMGPFPTVMLTKLQSWPGRSGTFGWPSIEAFGNLSNDQGQFWMQIGDQWQKNWAQAITVWSEFGKSKK
jgi:hypothetical protein